MSTNTGIFVFTPYGKGEVLGTRNDGIVIVQLRTTQGKPYLGYFHLTQVRQLKNNEHGEDSMMEGDNFSSKKRTMEEDDGVATQPQRVRCFANPFTDMTNHG